MENKEYAKECGLRLRRVRMAKNMSQQDLADKMFTTPQNVSKWEKEGIRDIDTIKNLSQILGQDLLSDERNEEGVVGEIGKHVLKKISENGGFIPVTTLIEEHMFGLKPKTVTEEIFKLQKIGMCVREQYKNFYDDEKDMLFITAKGVITLNNLLVFGSVQCKTYEQFIENRSTIQEYYDENKLEKLIRNLHYCGTYRIDYINYLHKKYEHVYIDETENDGCYVGDWMSAIPVLPGMRFRTDLLFRMIAGLDDNNLYNAAYLFVGKECECSPGDEFDDQVDEYGIPRTDEVLGFVSGKIKEWNSKIYDEREEHIDNSTSKPNYLSEDLDEMNFQQGNTDYFVEKRNAFVDGKYPSEWFSLEEIKIFIKENFRSAETPEEKEIDRILSEINKINSWTLEYYDCNYVLGDDDCAYFTDSRWVDAGIEELIKSYYNLPRFPSHVYIDESEAEE